MDFKVIHTNEKNKDFLNLVDELNQEYINQFGDTALNYLQYNIIVGKYEVILIYNEKNEAIACGSFKKFNLKDSIELKRMYVKKEYRKQGLASCILEKLEKIAIDQGFKFVFLETGVSMFPAIAFYKKFNYEIIDNFGVFEGDSICLCMKKRLSFFS